VQDVASDRTSPTEDGFAGLTYEARRRQSEQTADEAQDAPDYLKLMREARQRGQTYYTENLQGPVDTNYRAFRNKHFAGSKYWSTDYRNRSKLFRPKTRSAVRKANAAAISALFFVDRRNQVLGRRRQQSAAEGQCGADAGAVQLPHRPHVGQAAIPWFRICGGAHQDAMPCNRPAFRSNTGSSSCVRWARSRTSTRRPASRCATKRPARRKWSRSTSRSFDRPT